MTAFHRTSAWLALSRRMRALFKEQLPMACVDCGREVQPWDKWQVGHILSAAAYPDLALDPSNLGPSHTVCNQRAGGRDGARKTNNIKAIKKRRAEGNDYPDW